MSNSRLKHLKSENDKFKPVNEIISLFLFEKLNYFEEKGGRAVCFSLFHKFELLTVIFVQFATDNGVRYTEI